MRVMNVVIGLCFVLEAFCLLGIPLQTVAQQSGRYITPREISSNVYLCYLLAMVQAIAFSRKYKGVSDDALPLFLANALKSENVDNSQGCALLIACTLFGMFHHDGPIGRYGRDHVAIGVILNPLVVIIGLVSAFAVIFRWLRISSEKK